MISKKDFPSDFVWGVATSAYQIEGSPLADGADSSNWHDFALADGNVFEGHHGEVACDHYHRMEADVALMAELGVTAYRFSIAWPRIVPSEGQVNPQGIAFYSRLIDTLRKHDIQPYATIYHWDLPRHYQKRGGWLNPQIVEWFAEYSRILFAAFGDRVDHWMTINEPWVVAHCGFVEGTHPPGVKDPSQLPAAIHHMILAHFAAVKQYRESQSGEIGLALNLTPHDPVTDSDADQKAAMHANAYVNDLFLDGFLRGRYVPSYATLLGETPDRREAELQAAFQPSDFLGINYYLRVMVTADASVPVTGARGVQRDAAQYTEMGWEVCPEGLTRILLEVAARYENLPLFITENGAAMADVTVGESGTIEDLDRWKYLQGHFRAVANALQQSADVRGYFLWSFLDNFEWSYGYSKKFGIFAVDADQQRHWKRSARNYQAFLAE